jgi:hypothetical protein
MDLSSKQEPFLAERALLNQKQMSKLVDDLYEFRNSTGVEALGKIMEAKRDEYVLDILKMKATSSSPVELAVIQGKIKAIGDIIAFVNQQFFERAKTPKKAKKKVKRKPLRGPTEAGPAI